MDVDVDWRRGKVKPNFEEWATTPPAWGNLSGSLNLPRQIVGFVFLPNFYRISGKRKIPLVDNKWT